MTSLPRHWTATALAIAVYAAVFVAPSPASAAAGSIDCTGTSQITFSPGFTFDSQTVQATETDIFSPCVSTVEGITAGITVLEYPADGSCLTPLHSGPSTYPIHWNNGTSSTLSINFAITYVGGQAVSAIHGFVTAGVLAGATVTGGWVYTQPNALQCLSPPGVTELFGPLVLAISGT